MQWKCPPDPQADEGEEVGMDWELHLLQEREEHLGGPQPPIVHSKGPRGALFASPSNPIHVKRGTGWWGAKLEPSSSSIFWLANNSRPLAWMLAISKYLTIQDKHPLPCFQFHLDTHLEENPSFKRGNPALPMAMLNVNDNFFSQSLVKNSQGLMTSLQG